MEQSGIYLDYNATTPLAGEVLQCISDAGVAAWANPSSGHYLGMKAKCVVENGRAEIARMIGARSDEIVLTSGGTESNNMVFYSVIRQFGRKDGLLPHVISTEIEHDSVNLMLQALAKDGLAEVSYVKPRAQMGLVSADDIVGVIQDNTCLISMMLANNETGVIQPVAQVAEKLRQRGRDDVLIHTDASQAIGKVDVNVNRLQVDYLTIVGHKFYGPRSGALFVRELSSRGTPLFPMLYGGSQERSFRPGTENTPMIAGLGKAAELVTNNLPLYAAHMAEMRNYFESCLEALLPEGEVRFNCKQPDVLRLPNTSSVAFPRLPCTGRDLLRQMPSLIASTGAACHSGGGASAVLLASGIPPHDALRTLRVSVGRETTRHDVDRAIDVICALIQQLNAA